MPSAVPPPPPYMPEMRKNRRLLTASNSEQVWHKTDNLLVMNTITNPNFRHLNALKHNLMNKISI